MGLLLILVGLFKKVVIANYLATDMVDKVFLDPTLFGPADLLLAIYGYAVQIYCDFSGYTDMAIGIAALIGFQFQQNFNQPYRAEGVQDFWRRWHISLSNWLRDYLYIPLGGNRVSPSKMRCNLLITMSLGGLWHGAAWHYVFWGVLHGIALILEGLLPKRLGSTQPLWRRALVIILTFHFVCLTYIFFRAEYFSVALDYLYSFSNLSISATFCTPFLLSLVGFGLMAHIALPPKMLEFAERGLCLLPPVAQGILAGFIIVAIDAMSPKGTAPFIYFQF
jgi:D-alanyl-lipoteichoic acid acyltransferase DltB (MBOAT superfamily)